MLRSGILAVHTEISVSHKLEAVRHFGICQSRLQIAFLQDRQGIGIQIQTSVLLIVYSLFLIDDVLIKADLRLHCMAGGYPVDGSFHLPSGEAIELSASAGGAAFPKQGEDFISLCRSADMALYDVKRNGKAAFKMKGH